MKNILRIGICLIFGLIISCSSRDEEQENILLLPRTITTKSYLGNNSYEYQYSDGNKMKRVLRDNRIIKELFYTNNFITKIIDYNVSGEIRDTTIYEYANNKLSKETHIGSINYINYYTWIDNNHVSIESDEITTDGSTDKTEFYFSKGNVVKTTRHLHIPNHFTFDEVNIVESNTKNNPYKNVEGYSLIAFGITSYVFPQSNNITKITTTTTLYNSKGETVVESYFRVFDYSFNNQMFPLNMNVKGSFGDSMDYEFKY